MTLPSRRLLVLVPFLGCLVACAGSVGTFGPPPPPKGGQTPEPAPQPRFTIDTGLMDPWNMKKAGPTHMQVSPDGKYLLTLAMSSKENVQVWDLATQKKLHAFDNNIGTMHAHIAIAPDSRTAAYVQLNPKSGIILFDLVTGQRKQTILDERGAIINSHSPWRSMVFSPDGNFILYGGKQIAYWDTATGRMKGMWPGSSLCLTPYFDNGTKIANLADGSIYIRETAKGRVIKSLDAGRCRAIAITPDQKALIAVTNGQIKWWDLPGGDMRSEFKMEVGTYMHIVPIPKLRMVAWPTNSGFIICDLETGTEKQRVKVIEQPYVTGLAVTPDGATLLSAAQDGLIKGWRLNASGRVE